MHFAADMLVVNYMGVAAGIVAALAGMFLVVSAIVSASSKGRERISSVKKGTVPKYRKNKSLRYKSKIK